jgi:hypothetical protein
MLVHAHANLHLPQCVCARARVYCVRVEGCKQPPPFQRHLPHIVAGEQIRDCRGNSEICRNKSWPDSPDKPPIEREQITGVLNIPVAAGFQCSSEQATAQPSWVGDPTTAVTALPRLCWLPPATAALRSCVPALSTARPSGDDPASAGAYMRKAGGKSMVRRKSRACVRGKMRTGDVS